MNKKILIQLKGQKKQLFFSLVLFCVINLFSISAYAANEREVNTTKYPTDIEQQQQKRVTIDMKNQPLLSIVKEISKKSSIGLMLKNDSALNGIKDASLTVNNVTAKVALTQLLKGTGYTFSIVNNAINIYKARVMKELPITVGGVVVNKFDKSPIVGATVIIEGTGNGAITDAKGAFILRNIVVGSKIEISYTGMKVQSLIVNKSQLNLIIALEEDLIAVDDVIITGYQSIDKRMNTGSVSTVTTKDMDRIGALTVDQMLEGKATGLLITNNSSTVGAAAKVSVRSGGTFTGSRAPLWVVDGMIYEDPVPLSADDINSFDYVNLIGNAITGINPQDIESINILKDAAATSIYGTRASNGVIVVTTKRGKVGNASINYTGSVSIVESPSYSDFNLMNSSERIGVSREIASRNIEFPSQIDSYVGYEGVLRDYRTGEIDFNTFNSRVGDLETLNNDWFGDLFNTAIKTSHSANVSGGSETVRYYFSLGYNDEQDVQKSVNLNRITARSNLDVQLRENVKLTMGMSGSVQEANYNHSSVNLFDEAYYNSRAITAYNPDGSLNYISKPLKDGAGTQIDTDNIIHYGDYNIMNEMNESANKVDNKDFNFNVNLAWDIVTGVKLSSSTSYRNTTNITEEWITDKSFHVANLRTYDGIEDKFSETLKDHALVGPYGGLYSSGNTSQEAITTKIDLGFNKSFDSKHFLNLTVGYEASTSSYNGVSGTSPGYDHERGRNFVNIPAYEVDSNTGDVVGYDYYKALAWMTGDADGNSIYPSILDKLDNKMSAYMIFNYTYLNKYVLNFNMRSDGSNQFGQYEKYKFRPTWSASTRWNIHNEKFFSGVNNLEELSFRASYGFRGTPPEASPYLIISSYGFDEHFGEFATTLKDFPNANLTWEKTSTLNLGLNHSWFKGRLSGALDFAYSKGTDLLLSRPVSLVNGSNNQLYNGGSKEDYSYEFSIRGEVVRTKDFGVSLSANFSYQKEKIISGYESDILSVKDYLNGNIYLTDFPINAFYSYKFGGLDQNGLPTFEGINDAPESNTINEYFENSLEYSGSRIPLFYGGFNLEVRYKQLSVRSSLSYKIGHSVRLLDLYDSKGGVPMPSDNVSAEFNNRWRKSGDEAHTSIPGFSSSKLYVGTSADKDIQVWNDKIVDGYNGWEMYDLSNARVVDGSHIRINNVTISYAVPNECIKKLNVSSLRLSLQVSNLGVIAFDKDLKGQDPDQVQGIGMPSLPQYSFSLSFGF